MSRDCPLQREAQMNEPKNNQNNWIFTEIVMLSSFHLDDRNKKTMQAIILMQRKMAECELKNPKSIFILS
jgi:hypothetical protein